MDSISMCLNTLYMSNMDVGSNLNIMSASTMKWHHFHSIIDPEFPNLGPTWLVEWYKGAPIDPWQSIPMAQSLYIYLIWMWEAVSIEWQPQKWRNGIISTPWGGQNSPIRGQLGRWNSIRVHPYTPETAISNIDVVWKYYQGIASQLYSPINSPQTGWGMVERVRG